LPALPTKNPDFHAFYKNSGMSQFKKSLVWFRRDLRSSDHSALHHALMQSEQVYCAFIFDKDILDQLPRADRRVEFIHASVVELDADLRSRDGGLTVRHGPARTEILRLATELGVDAVFANRDYEPAAIARDAAVSTALAQQDRPFFLFKDQVIFEQDEVLSLSGTPFSVYTPYKNAWRKKLQAGHDGADYLSPWPDDLQLGRLAAYTGPIPTLAELGFQPTGLAIPTGMQGAATLLEDFSHRIARYEDSRDYPAIKGPSYLSVHLRFGTISIRSMARLAWDAERSGSGGAGAAVWLNELIWRDFYFMILYQNPHVAGGAFKPAYDAIEWETGVQADAQFAAWCEGRTGYPLVDAAMLQLNQTGYMHNRLRMVTACFLIKDLGIDWRCGEAYFAEKLNDFDLSANNGGWQWASSSGCDAQPYFRIFNPVTQSEKFDAEGKFIKRYLPQLARLPAKQIHAPWECSPLELDMAGVKLGSDYALPIVRHDEARLKTLARYAVVKKTAV
jgi:deoxyribodipyrimidine photo-lyase